MKRRILLILGIVICLLLPAVCLAEGENAPPIGDNPITGDTGTGMTTPAPTDVPTSTPTTAPTSGGNSGGNSGSQSTASTPIPTDPREPKPDDNVSNATDAPDADATGEPNSEPTAEAVETVTTAPTDAPKAAETNAPTATDAPEEPKTGGAGLWIAIAAAALAVAGGAFALIRWKGGKKA